MSTESSFAIPDPILITHSTDIQNVIFDGKWTNEVEWKASSHNILRYENETVIHLRTAHHENFIYVFVDPINDQSLDINMDKTTICFDAKNNKNIIFDNDDFCFSVVLGEKNGIIQHGFNNNYFETIENSEFIAVSSISDENDRYTKTPHPSYEFRIPIDLLERSDNYGFYLSTYDASLDKFYSWPENSTQNSTSSIPSPSEWGDLISPDKSLPEMHFPFFILGIMFFIIILVQSKRKTQLFQSF